MQGSSVLVEQEHIDTDSVFDVVVVGGGSAGLAAAAAAAEGSTGRVLVLEREEYLGGVLPQCVHDGFGLYLYEESLTGPEYAHRWVERVQGNDRIQVALATTVLSIANPDEQGIFHVDALGIALGGRAIIHAYSVVYAAGCRERTRGALQIPGGRPAGILTAGSAQYMVNVANQLPGDKVVVLGSGDIGLIMARRMTLEGAEVRLVLGQEATGLVRNHIRCIQDFNIPIRYGWGLVSVHGYGQLQGVSVAPVGDDGSFDLTRRQYVRCNVLLVACGLIPEREVLHESGLATTTEGLFLCGNANVPHDLVDQVTQEGIGAGFAAARYAAKRVTGRNLSLPAGLARMASIPVSEPTGKMNDVHDELPEGMRRIVCTECPSGCVMQASGEGGITGNGCARGREFAKRELVCPVRIYTGTVRIANAAGRTLLPVRTSKPVAKDKLSEIARFCRHVMVDAPVRVGDVLCDNVADTGVALLASDDGERTGHGGC